MVAAILFTPVSCSFSDDQSILGAREQTDVTGESELEVQSTRTEQESVRIAILDITVNSVEVDVWIEAPADSLIGADDSETDGPVATLAAESLLRVRALRCPRPYVSIRHLASENRIAKTFPSESNGLVAYSLPDTPGGLRDLDVYIPSGLGTGSAVVRVGCEHVFDVPGDSETIVVELVRAIDPITPTRETLADRACLDRGEGVERCQTPTVDFPLGMEQG